MRAVAVLAAVLADRDRRVHGASSVTRSSWPLPSASATDCLDQFQRRAPDFVSTGLRRSSRDAGLCEYRRRNTSLTPRRIRDAPALAVASSGRDERPLGRSEIDLVVALRESSAQLRPSLQRQQSVDSA